MKFNVILASDINYGISKNNLLPWKISEDLKFFNKITTSSSNNKQNIVIMGLNTAKEIGKPLKDRYNIVLSSKENLENFIMMKSLDDAFEHIKKIEYNEIFIIGGSKLFDFALTHTYLDKIYFTQINKNYNCDNFVIPILNRNNMKYNIIERKKCDDKNTNEEIELIFYLITKIMN